MNRSFLSIAGIALLLAVAPGARASTTIFSDNFDYTAWNSGARPMTSVWTMNGTGPVPVLRASNPDYPNLTTPYLQLYNAVIKVGLGQTLTRDFTIHLNAQNVAGGRAFWIGLFNDTGTEGYGFRWDSSTQGSNGSLRVVRYSVASASDLAWNMKFSDNDTDPGFFIDAVSQIGRPGPSIDVIGKSATFVPVSLSWDAATNRLTLSINGNTVSTITDTSYSSFSNLYIGSVDGIFGSVSVQSSIPESSTAVVGIALPALLCVMAYKRRKLSPANHS